MDASPLWHCFLAFPISLSPCASVYLQMKLHPPLILCPSKMVPAPSVSPQLSYRADSPNSIIAGCVIIPGH